VLIKVELQKGDFNVKIPKTGIEMKIIKNIVSKAAAVAVLGL